MPAYAENVKTVTREAQADHTSDQHKLVVFSGSRGFALAGAGDKANGVLLNKPSSIATSDGTLGTNSGFSDGSGGTIALIDAGGTAPIVSGGPITAGDALAAGAGGVAVVAGTGANIIGYAEGAASQAGVIVPVSLTHGGESA